MVKLARSQQDFKTLLQIAIDRTLALAASLLGGFASRRPRDRSLGTCSPRHAALFRAGLDRGLGERFASFASAPPGPRYRLPPSPMTSATRARWRDAARPRSRPRCRR